jgi:hypothetical protein
MTSSNRLNDIYTQLLDYRETILENPQNLTLEESIQWLISEHQYFIKNDILTTSYMEHLEDSGVIDHIYNEEDNTLDLDNFFLINDFLLMQRNILLKLIKKHKLENQYVNEVNKLLSQYNLAIDSEDQTLPRKNTTLPA